MRKTQIVLDTAGGRGGAGSGKVVVLTSFFILLQFLIVTYHGRSKSKITIKFQGRCLLYFQNYFSTYTSPKFKIYTTILLSFQCQMIERYHLPSRRRIYRQEIFSGDKTSGNHLVQDLENAEGDSEHHSSQPNWLRSCFVIVIVCRRAFSCKQIFSRDNNFRQSF